MAHVFKNHTGAPPGPGGAVNAAAAGLTLALTQPIHKRNDRTPDIPRRRPVLFLDPQTDVSTVYVGNGLFPMFVDVTATTKRSRQILAQSEGVAPVVRLYSHDTTPRGGGISERAEKAEDHDFSVMGYELVSEDTLVLKIRFGRAIGHQRLFFMEIDLDTSPPSRSGPAQLRTGLIKVATKPTKIIMTHVPAAWNVPKLRELFPDLRNEKAARQSGSVQDPEVRIAAETGADYWPDPAGFMTYGLNFKTSSRCLGFYSKNWLRVASKGVEMHLCPKRPQKAVDTAGRARRRRPAPAMKPKAGFVRLAQRKRSLSEGSASDGSPGLGPQEAPPAHASRDPQSAAALLARSRSRMKLGGSASRGAPPADSTAPSGRSGVPAASPATGPAAAPEEPVSSDEEEGFRLDAAPSPRSARENRRSRSRSRSRSANRNYSHTRQRGSNGGSGDWSMLGFEEGRASAASTAPGSQGAGSRSDASESSEGEAEIAPLRTPAPSGRRVASRGRQLALRVGAGETGHEVTAGGCSPGGGELDRAPRRAPSMTGLAGWDLATRAFGRSGVKSPVAKAHRRPRTVTPVSAGGGTGVLNWGMSEPDPYDIQMVRDGDLTTGSDEFPSPLELPKSLYSVATGHSSRALAGRRAFGDALRDASRPSSSTPLANATGVYGSAGGFARTPSSGLTPVGTSPSSGTMLFVRGTWALPDDVGEPRSDSLAVRAFLTAPAAATKTAFSALGAGAGAAAGDGVLPVPTESHGSVTLDDTRALLDIVGPPPSITRSTSAHSVSSIGSFADWHPTCEVAPEDVGAGDLGSEVGALHLSLPGLASLPRVASWGSVFTSPRAQPRKRRRVGVDVAATPPGGSFKSGPGGPDAAEGAATGMVATIFSNDVTRERALANMRFGP